MMAALARMESERDKDRKLVEEVERWLGEADYPMLDEDRATWNMHRLLMALRRQLGMMYIPLLFLALLASPAQAQFAYQHCTGLVCTTIQGGRILTSFGVRPLVVMPTEQPAPVVVPVVVPAPMPQAVPAAPAVVPAQPATRTAAQRRSDTENAMCQREREWIAQQPDPNAYPDPCP